MLTAIGILIVGLILMIFGVLLLEDSAKNYLEIQRGLMFGSMWGLPSSEEDSNLGKRQIRLLGAIFFLIGTGIVFLIGRCPAERLRTAMLIARRRWPRFSAVRPVNCRMPKVAALVPALAIDICACGVCATSIAIF